MVNKSAVSKIIAELNKRDLSKSDRSLLISAMLNKLVAIPLCDIITIDGNKNLFVNDRLVKKEEQIRLRESASAVLNSKAFQLIRQQVVYATFVQAAHKSTTPDELIFGKAALWWGQQEDIYLKMLAPEDRDGNLSPNPED